MKLPDNIVTALRRQSHHFQCHAEWHLARVPESSVRDHFRGAYDHACRCLTEPPGAPIPIDRPGSGEQFLTMHHGMLKDFRLIVTGVGADLAEYAPWTNVPKDIAAALHKLAGDDGYLQAALDEIERLVESPSADDLGSFIESTDTVRPGRPGYNLHQRLHVVIGTMEKELLDTEWDMTYAGNAHRNAHFYRLHGWIDGFYARWQQLHPVPVGPAPVVVTPGAHSLTPAHTHGGGAPVR
jgi:hypothetical protein